MKRPACVVGCCLLVFLGLFFYLKPPQPVSLADISGKRIVISGIVDDKYQKKENTYLTVKEAGIISGMKSEKKYNVIVKLKEAEESLGEAPRIGSAVVVSGKGMEFPEARNPGNFDQARYQMIRGMDFEIYKAEVLEASGGHGVRYIDEGLCLLRERLADTADRLYEEDDAGTVRAMLLGDRTGLTEELSLGYRRAGMSHILCISSLHITLIGLGLLRLLRKTGMNKAGAYIIAFSMISIYGRFTGSGVSTVRALITFSLMMTADLLGRTTDLMSSMSVAAVVILLMHPLYALDAGFVLSFSAVCGIGMLGPPLKKLIPARGGFFGSLRTSLSVTLFMLPEVMYYFYQVSLFSVLINQAVIPLLGILLVFSLISVILGGLCMPLGVFTGFPVRIILASYRAVTFLNDHLPYSVITTGRPGLWQILLYYLILAVMVFFTDRREADRYMRMGILFGTFIAVFILSVRIRPELSLTMIDVGQGDCHFLEAGGDKTMMIDCGSSDVDEVAKYRVVPYVLYRGYDALDYAVLTHSDEDHINGYIGMLEGGDKGGLRIRTLILPDIAARDEKYNELVRLAAESGVKIRKIKAGDRFTVGRVCLECLNPKAGISYPDINASSVCLKVSLQRSSFRALYTGDVQDEGERILMEMLGKDSSRGRYTLLKCAHHGSRYSTPEELLKLVKPAYTFISAGVDNAYSHPHRELIERLEDTGTRIYTTKDRGAVRMDIKGNNIRVENYVNRKGG